MSILTFVHHRQGNDFFYVEYSTVVWRLENLEGLICAKKIRKSTFEPSWRATYKKYRNKIETVWRSCTRWWYQFEVVVTRLTVVVDVIILNYFILVRPSSCVFEKREAERNKEEKEKRRKGDWRHHLSRFLVRPVLACYLPPRSRNQSIED